MTYTIGLEQWLRSGERGVSSETMVEVFEKMPPGMLTGRHGQDHPHDPADLRRCVLLLEAVPEYRERLGEMRSVSLVWNVLVGRWGDLEATLKEEMRRGWRAPKTYEEMRRLIKNCGEKW